MKVTLKTVDGTHYATTIANLAALVGVHRQTVMGWHRDGAPGKCRHGYPVAETVTWARESGPWSPRPIDVPEDMQGEVTEALERYRLAKAKLAERELQQLDRELVPATELHAVLSAASSRIKECNQRLGREYGPDAQRILNESIQAAGELLDRILPEVEGEK